MPAAAVKSSILEKQLCGMVPNLIKIYNEFTAEDNAGYFNLRPSEIHCKIGLFSIKFPSSPASKNVFNYLCFSD